jgi:hypothetical protein
MIKVMKNGVVAVTLSAVITISYFAPSSLALAQEQQQTAKKQKNTNARHNTGTSGSASGKSKSAGHYQYSQKKPLNMACGLRFNPTSSSGCNY